MSFQIKQEQVYIPSYYTNTTNNSTIMTERELTYGEKAVGLKFNPSNHNEVDVIKRHCADIIDLFHDARTNTTDVEKKRMYSLAITAIQEGQMWGVKACTW